MSGGPLDEPGSRLIVRQLAEHECIGDRTLWEDLLARSNANRLFMGWPWQSAWWETWREVLGLEPLFLGVFLGQTIVGLAPLYAHERASLAGYRVRGLHFVGTAYRIAPTVRTEYVDCIIDARYETEVALALTQALQREHWDALTVCDNVAPAALDPLARAYIAGRVERSRDQAVAVHTVGNFQDWLQGLRQSARRRIYNQRRILRECGEITIRELMDWDAALDLLNDFHVQRWGRPVFEGHALTFHKRFLARLGRTGHPHFSALCIDGQVHSILYDVHVHGVTYNLQSGFEQGFRSNLSLGALHLGMAIEAGFRQPEVLSYDLLAGGGQNTFYKSQFNGTVTDMKTFQIIRNPAMRLAYHGYHYMPHRLRSKVLRGWRRLNG